VGDEIKVWADVLYGNANLPWPGKVEDSEREPIPVWVKHEIIGRDGAQCRYVFANGKRCTQRRWLHVHHLQEVRNGGSNTVKNLITLCANHHRMVHLKQAHGETFQKPVQKNLELL
jgi:hypothetical protein